MLLSWLSKLTVLVAAVITWHTALHALRGMIDKITWYAVILVAVLVVAKQLTPALQASSGQQYDPEQYAA